MKKQMITYIIGAAVVAGGLSASPVEAKNMRASIEASSATSTGTNKRVSSFDSKEDRRAVYASYYRQGDSKKHRLDNKKGYLQRTTSKAGKTISKLRACVNIKALPDKCSGWGYY